MSLEAQRALLHHIRVRIERAHIVRAALQARFAPDALLGIDQHHARGFVAVRCARRAHFDAAGVLALLALQGNPVLLDVREGARGSHGVHAVVAHAQIDVVLKLAGRNAAVASAAAVEIDNQAVSHQNTSFV